MQARNPPWLRNSGKMSPEVQNRGISGPKKDLCPPKTTSKHSPRFNSIYGTSVVAIPQQFSGDGRKASRPPQNASKTRLRTNWVMLVSAGLNAQVQAQFLSGHLRADLLFANRLPNLHHVTCERGIPCFFNAASLGTSITTFLIKHH